MMPLMSGLPRHISEPQSSTRRHLSSNLIPNQMRLLSALRVRAPGRQVGLLTRLRSPWAICACSVGTVLENGADSGGWKVDTCVAAFAESILQVAAKQTNQRRTVWWTSWMSEWAVGLEIACLVWPLDAHRPCSKMRRVICGRRHV